MTPKAHTLKCWPAYFQAVRRRIKGFEFRLNDRDFKPGDLLILREFDPRGIGYTGPYCHRRITYVLSLKTYLDAKGWRWAIARRIMPDLVILSIDPIDEEIFASLTEAEPSAIRLGNDL